MSDLIPIVFVFVGLGALGYGVSMMRRARESETWPSVVGEVTHSRIGNERAGSYELAAAYRS